MKGVDVSIEVVRTVVLLIFCLLLGAACNEEDTPGKEAPLYEGVVRPSGEVVDAAETFEVTSAGGTFQSADGILEIKIPAGALDKSITLGIQLLENTAPQGVGYGYRITPEVEFQKAVHISFSYADRMVSWADGLGVAYQASDGIWYWPGNMEHDRMNKKITVATTHFSDWSLFESMYLTPTEALIAPGEEIEITAYRVLPEEFDDDLLAPLVLEVPVPLPESRPLEQEYIRQWDLAGEGMLTPSKNTAVYTAPEDLPESNPMTVSLEVNLHNGSKAFLLSHVSVVGCEVTLNGGPYQNRKFTSTVSAMPVYIEEEDLNIISFYGEDGGQEVLVYVMYPGKAPGKLSWTETTCYVTTMQAVNDQVIQGSHMIPDSSPPEVHTGFVNITHYNEETGIITGEFSGGFTYAVACTPDPCVSYGTIEGRFIASMY